MLKGDKPGQEHLLNSKGGPNCMNCFGNPGDFLKFFNQCCIFNHNKAESYYYFRNFKGGNPEELMSNIGYNLPLTSVSVYFSP